MGGGLLAECFAARHHDDHTGCGARRVLACRIVFIIATLDESELPGSNKELATILKLRHPSGSSHPARALLAAGKKFSCPSNLQHH